MPPKKFPTVWPAEPHTIAKIEILKSYLVAWFQILGRSKHGQDLLYVDGFAGPGEYTNYPVGSPLAALTAAQRSIELTADKWVAGKVHCAFIEPDPDRFKNLAEKISSFDLPSTISLHAYPETFTKGLESVKKEIPLPFNGQHPLFVFIDPFGATGVPFTVVAELLKSPCSEVLINLDADGIARIFKAGKSADHERNLTEIFAGDEWRPLFSTGDPFEVLCRKVLQLYKTKLRSIERVQYVFPFEMRTSAAVLNYYLVFASQHWLGLEKMKQSMRKIDKSGSYCFSDASVGQSSLFRFDNPEEHSLTLYDRFRGRETRYSELRDFALNETPFTNPKSMLKDLERNKHRIAEVKSTDPKRREGTFNEKTLIYVRFN